MEKLPIVDKALLEYIERLYPDKSPELAWQDREVWFRRGAVDVCRTLRRIFDEQQESMSL